MKTRTNRNALIPLWASAFVIAALIIMQAGRVAPMNEAQADMVAVGSDYSVMTTLGGNQEVVYVLDNREGRLFVYEPNANQGGLQLADVQNISELIDLMRRRQQP
ncbi:MAG: hypothetical protein ACF8PN_03130 [Phycisphaerales bacterium]